MPMWEAGLRKNNGRFSFLELIVVVVIIGFMLVAAIPKVGYVANGIKRAESVKTINSAFHMASTIASATGMPAKLIFDLGENHIQIERSSPSKSYNSGEGETDALSSPVLFNDVQKFNLPLKTVVDDDQFFIDPVDGPIEYQFYPNGEASGPEVSILISGYYRLTIDVDRLTGRPLILENED